LFSPPAPALRKGLEDRNVDVTGLNGDDRSSSDRNLVTFRSVNPEFTRLECVQQASISIFGLVSPRSTAAALLCRSID